MVRGEEEEEDEEGKEGKEDEGVKREVTYIFKLLFHLKYKVRSCVYWL